MTLTLVVPSAFALTRPLPSTVATALRLDFHVSRVFASCGVMAQFSCRTSPLFTVTVPEGDRLRLRTSGSSGTSGVSPVPALPPSAATMRESLTPLWMMVFVPAGQ